MGVAFHQCFEHGRLGVGCRAQTHTGGAAGVGNPKADSNGGAEQTVRGIDVERRPVVVRFVDQPEAVGCTHSLTAPDVSPDTM